MRKIVKAMENDLVPYSPEMEVLFAVMRDTDGSLWILRDRGHRANLINKCGWISMDSIIQAEWTGEYSHKPAPVFMAPTPHACIEWAMDSGAEIFLFDDDKDFLDTLIAGKLS